MTDIDLSVRYAGLDLQCPVFGASHAPNAPFNLYPEKWSKLLKKYVELGASAVETGFISPIPEGKPATGRLLAAKTKGFGKEGIFTQGPVDDIVVKLKHGIKLIKMLKEDVDVPVIANMIGPDADVEGWVKHARTLEDAGADMLELNMSCPLSAGELKTVITEQLPSGAGFLLGQIPEKVYEITKAIVNSVSIPVAFKSTPETGYPRMILVARAVEKAGGRGYVAINNPITIAPPDIYRGGKPKFPVLEKQTLGGSAGPWTRYLAYKEIGILPRFVSLDLSAVGGIVAPEHAVEMMMLGAKTVQLSSGLFWKGITFIKNTLEFLKKYMEEQGYQRVYDFIGLAQKYIVSAGEMEWPAAIAVVDEEKCNGCGLCLDTFCVASYMENGKAKVDSKFCGGCGLCLIICPISGARSIVKRE